MGCSHPSTMLGWTESWPMRLASTWSMLMPPFSTAPFSKGTPESRLPVCPGWMPTPVADLLKRPSMKFILVFSFSIGWRLLPSSMDAPDPLAHQWLPFTPLPQKSAAKRFGIAVGTSPAIVSAPQTGSDSIHGSAMVTPTPRRKVRRESRSWRAAAEVSSRVSRMGSYGFARSDGPRLLRNCGLVTRVSTRVPNLCPLAASLARMSRTVISSERIRLRPSA